VNPRQREFDTMAARWDEVHPPAEAAAAIERGLALVEPLSGAAVADIGCGTGILLGPLLRRLGPGGRVIACDLSERMLAIARERHPDPRIEWRQGDALAHPPAPGSLDVVLCFDALPHFPDPRATVRTMAGWLAPGGRLLVWHDIGRERLAAVHREAGPVLADDLLPPPEALAGTAVAAGLEVGLAIEDEESYTFLARRPAGG